MGRLTATTRGVRWSGRKPSGAGNAPSPSPKGGEETRRTHHSRPPCGGRAREGGENLDFALTETQQDIRSAVHELCAGFGDAYWRKLDETHAYPDEFVKALTEAGWLACLIPPEYGGSRL